ncbi:hypothetical protein [Frankia sp. EI5c]|uniref:hypothetical protein n=1 Tax=Frankia sp. EI5c TaxID=683316 RepID=UPI000FF88D2F|nr:hypothetical protein [Frankia sp. EI5c]
MSEVGEELTGRLGEDDARLLTAWKTGVLAIGDDRLRRFALVALSPVAGAVVPLARQSVKVTADRTGTRSDSSERRLRMSRISAGGHSSTRAGCPTPWCPGQPASISDAGEGPGGQP